MRDEAADRAAIVAEALTWVRTPYAHAQRLKGCGCDCAGLPLEVYAAVGLIPPTDVGLYSHQWHLHRSAERYLEWVERFAHEIPRAEAHAGDFLVWRFGRTYSHGAILIDARRIVHAYAQAGKVILDDAAMHPELKNRPVKAFSFWPARRDDVGARELDVDDCVA
jgi:NlpC/P60 family putative phage cell wall peptidase